MDDSHQQTSSLLRGIAGNDETLHQISIITGITEAALLENVYNFTITLSLICYVYF